MASPPAIDHIIILMPHKDIVSSPTWLTDNFTISPGGRHADGKTENKLLQFKDGSYIELIAFIDDDAERRAGHWWDKEYGVVDFALTSSLGHFDPAINERLKQTNVDISYDAPRRGGRTRPDGVQMEWEVTFPNGVDRGLVPFWCHDVTPRIRRVPLSDVATTHPCGAVGVHSVVVKASAEQLPRLMKATAAIVNSEAQEQYALSAVVPGRTEPFLCFRSSDDGGQHIEICMQTSELYPGIEQKVGNGLVKIAFSA